MMNSSIRAVDESTVKRNFRFRTFFSGEASVREKIDPDSTALVHIMDDRGYFSIKDAIYLTVKENPSGS